MVENFFYVVRLGLSSNSFAQHTVLKYFPNAYEADIVSQSFSEYKECSDACNLLLTDMTLELSKPIKHMIMWHANPAFTTMEAKIDSVKLSEWKPNELLRLFIVNPSLVVSENNIIPAVAMASIFCVPAQKISGVISKTLH